MAIYCFQLPLTIVRREPIVPSPADSLTALPLREHNDVVNFTAQERTEPGSKLCESWNIGKQALKIAISTSTQSKISQEQEQNPTTGGRRRGRQRRRAVQNMN
nr:uncharacterized protein LOC118877898 [Drosophila suzukii]